MKIAGAEAMKPDQVRDAIRQLGDVELGQLIGRLDRSTRIEQAALHFARGEQRRRRRRQRKESRQP
ncbi:hypothetical protein B9Y88_02780 [Stenotrophomonas maltophilia]|uniref:hypothetical protein n=1 Tax=Stenotrophomonas muris TaxID=2963283 RepID=UPI000C2688F9|nr:hypothetical protein B9Y88_02780 [Stenotrophomonas maltophilia]